MDEKIILPRSEEEIIHTDAHPFCSDLECPCHNASDYMALVGDPIDAGEMSAADGLRLCFGQCA